jgi:hypothetical protein
MTRQQLMAKEFITIIRGQNGRPAQFEIFLSRREGNRIFAVYTDRPLQADGERLFAHDAPICLEDHLADIVINDDQTIQLTLPE